MNIVTLPVSVITLRYFEKRYEAHPAPYVIKLADEFYNHLCFDPPRLNTSITKKTYELLSEEIALSLPPVLHKKLLQKKRYLIAGNYLHRVIYSKMIAFIEAQVLAGVSAQGALKNFLSYYNITEDDFGLDSAYQAWKRYKRYFLPKNRENNFLFWSSSVPQKKAKRKCKTYVSSDILVPSVFEYFEGEIPDMIYIKKITAFLLHRYSKLTHQQISKLFDVSRRQIGNYINDIDFALNYYDNVKLDVIGITDMLNLESANKIEDKTASIAA